jgi:hypothetical protein
MNLVREQISCFFYPEVTRHSLESPLSFVATKSHLIMILAMENFCFDFARDSSTHTIVGSGSQQLCCVSSNMISVFHFFVMMILFVLRHQIHGSKFNTFFSEIIVFIVISLFWLTE